MCGRFALSHVPIFLLERYGLLDPIKAPRYNIAPTRHTPVIIRRAGESPELESMHWGLVPSWSRDMALAARLINARADTVDEKRSFRDAFRWRRCLVPASGFYEWRREGGDRTPHYFSASDETAPLVFAGLWELWTRSGHGVYSFTIITTEANATVAPVHDRMPVILPPADWDEWLDPDNHHVPALKALLRPAAEGTLHCWPVGPHVNNSRNDGKECITRIPE